MDQRNRGEELLSLSWKSSSTCSLPICSKASPAFLGCSLDALLQTVEHFVLIIMWSVCDALTDACAFSDKLVLLDSSIFFMGHQVSKIAGFFFVIPVHCGYGTFPEKSAVNRPINTCFFPYWFYGFFDLTGLHFCSIKRWKYGLVFVHSNAWHLASYLLNEDIHPIV